MQSDPQNHGGQIERAGAYMIQNQRVVLASGSPRRLELLGQIGIRPEVRPSQIEEKVTSQVPKEVVMELSSRKAEDVAGRAEADTLILGADTVVAVDKEILGKPGSREEAVRMIRKLQGRTHQVWTGVTLIYKEKEKSRGITFAEKTEVLVYPMTEEEILGYVDTGDPMDKAGAYGIQGLFAAYIQGICGDYNTVVGLPLGRTVQEWKRLMEETEENQYDQIDCN